MAEDRPDNDKTRTHTPLSAGMMVTHFKIIERVGAGGMGEVYLAEDTKLNRRVALKFMPLQFAADEDFKARFTREAQAAASLNHPNIVTVFEVSEFRGQPFFAMEHCEGQPLRDFIKGKDLPVDTILDLGIQICEGLREAHDAGVVHRDIKPSNIILDKKGRPKLLDFGLAAIQGNEKLTKTGSTLGTVGYMSPEQVQGKPVDQRSDLFSLGVLLYEMTAGRLPFKGETEAATLNAILRDAPEPLKRFKADVPDGLQMIIDRALDKDVETRYQTASGMLADLKREKKALQPAAVSKPVEVPEKKSRKNFLIPALMVIIALLILILKPWKLEVEPTQEAIASQNRLAVMYFDNLIDPEDSARVARMITSLLITDLSESQYLQVVSRQRLYDILKLLGKEDLKAIDKTVASEVARRAEVKWILTGDILRLEPNIILTSDISDAATGEVLATQRISGEAGEDLFSVVDKLSALIKEDLTLPEAANEESGREVADVTTHSPEAYRYYLEGWEYLDRYYLIEAEKSFRKALEFDSTFAMVYFILSFTTADAESKRLIDEAVKYSNNASQLEKLYIDARAAQLERNYQQAITILDDLLKRYPDDKAAYELKGLCYRALRQYDQAVLSSSRIIELDSLDKGAYNELAYSYNYLGEFENSIWAINKYIELAPDEPNPYDSRGELYALNGKLDEAIASFEKALEIDPDFMTSVENLGNMYLFKREYTKAESLYQAIASHPDKQTRALGRLALARVPLHQGRFQDALRILEIGIETDRMELGESLKMATKLWVRGVIYGYQIRDLDRAIAEFEKSIQIRQKIDPADRFISFLKANVALFYVGKGDFEKADEILDEIKYGLEQSQSQSLENYWFGRAMVSFARENFDSAAVYFEKLVNLTPIFVFRIYLARSYFGAGRLGDAVELFEQALQTYDANRAFWPHFTAVAQYWLGLAYEESGWTYKAILQYEKFLDIWKDADTGLQQINDARERLARLKSKT